MKKQISIIGQKKLITILAVVIFASSFGQNAARFQQNISLPNVVERTTADSIPVFSAKGVIKHWISVDNLISGVNSNEFVKLTGAQTIAGAKTFTSHVTAPAYRLGGWEIVPSGSNLEFKFNGVVRMRLKSDGVIEAVNFKLGL